MAEIIKGKVYVVGDNIDTDQIIPAQYLNLVPTIAEEYRKLGSYAMSGLPDEYQPRFVETNAETTVFPIIIGGGNFGCGSSREHAPIALGAAGAKAVVAASFARIFFRNCISSGEIYPLETPRTLTMAFKTGDEAEIDLDRNTITNCTTGKTYELSDPGAMREVIEAGGIFNFARRSGMIG